MLENHKDYGSEGIEDLLERFRPLSAPPPIFFRRDPADSEVTEKTNGKSSISAEVSLREYKIDAFLKKNFTKIYPDLYLLEAAVSMFQHKREGDQLRHIFNTATIHSYDRLTAGSNRDGYYIPAAEKEIITKYSDYFNQIAYEGRNKGEPLTLFDLGTGTPDATEQKILPVLEATGATKYVGVDEAIGSAAVACHTLSQLKPGLELYIQRADFNVMDFSHDKDGKPWEGKRLIVQFGSTLGNIAGSRYQGPPEEAVVTALSNIRSHLEKGEHFILGLDHNRDEESLHAAYSGDLHDELGRGLLERIYEDLPHKNFNPDNFDVVSGLNPENGLYFKGYKAREAGSFVLGRTRITHDANEVFVYNNSWKYSPEFVERCFKLSGFEPSFVMADKLDRVRMYDLKAA